MSSQSIVSFGEIRPDLLGRLSRVVVQHYWRFTAIHEKQDSMVNSETFKTKEKAIHYIFLDPETLLFKVFISKLQRTIVRCDFVCCLILFMA